VPRGPKPRPKKQAGASAPKPPSGVLGRDAAREYARVVKLLAPHRVLTTADRAALTVYASAVAQYHQAERLIAKEGIRVFTEKGEIVHPAVNVQTKAWDRIRVLLAEFGFSPAARARLKLGEDRDQEPDDGFDL